MIPARQILEMIDPILMPVTTCLVALNGASQHSIAGLAKCRFTNVATRWSQVLLLTPLEFALPELV